MDDTTLAWVEVLLCQESIVSAQTLRGIIGAAIPGAFLVAAQVLGVTPQEFAGRLERGEVHRAEFLPKFLEALRENLEGTGRIPWEF